MAKNTGKWIGGLLGWAVGGPIGALFGVGIGSLFDGTSSLFSTATSSRSAGARNSFSMSLLVLSAAVMKADRRVMRSELEYVKDFLRRNFGDQAVREGMAILKDLLEKEIQVDQVAAQVATNMPVSQRLQLFHYLCGIAQSDGLVDDSEVLVLRQIAMALRLPAADVESILAMFRMGAYGRGSHKGGPGAGSRPNSQAALEDAYRVLEVSPQATDDEVKKAYRRMAMKYHPDKVSTLGEDVRKGAEEKFKTLSEAYDLIKKSRGMN
jgi:DnaJ like chaperone protein